MRRLIAILCCALPFTPAPGAAQTVAGTWDAEMNTPGATVSFQFLFRVSGDTLRGTVLRSSGDVPLQGRVKGDSLWFSYTIEYNNNSLLISMVGQVVGDSLFGRVDFNGEGQDQFWAHRRKSSTTPGLPAGGADRPRPAATPAQPDRNPGTLRQ